MSRNNSFPPIQKRSNNAAIGDLSGEMTIDQFLSKCSQLSAPKEEETYVRRTPSPMAAARAASNIRRTSIRRLHSGKTIVQASQSPVDGLGGAGRSFSRSEQALLLTERSAVLLDDLPPPVDSDDTLSNGDSVRSTDRSGWQAQFQQSPSPDNRRGDKAPPPRRKSLLERWEEVQDRQRAPQSAHGSSSDSQFEDDAYPYHPRVNTRGSSQETGFEPTPGDEAAQRPPSGIDSLATPRSGPRPPSSSSTGASSPRSDLSEKSAQPAPTGRSLFDSGNVETIDDVIESLLTSRAPHVAKPRHPARGRPADYDWDQVDRSSHPVIETVRFPELVKAASPPTVGELERYGGGGGGGARPASSATQVLERLSQVMTQRTPRGTAAQDRGADQPPEPPPVPQTLEDASSQRPPSGRSPRVRPPPAAHRAPPAAPLTSTVASRRAGWRGAGPPKPPRLSVRRTSAPEEGAQPAAGWLESGPAEGDSRGRQVAVLDLESEGEETGGGRPVVIRASTPDLSGPPREAFCAVATDRAGPGARTAADESDGVVDSSLTQRLLWRQLLRSTAVTISILVAAAAVALIVLLVL